MDPLLRHTGVLISLGLVGAGALVFTLIGFLMGRAGGSTRPIWFVAGMFAIVVLPQLTYHVYDALRQAAWESQRLATAGAPDLATPSADAAAPAAASAALTAALEERFGADVNPALVNDVRSVFGDVFADAEAARFATFPSGESVLLARFPDRHSADRAWRAYLNVTGLGPLAAGDERRGFTASRPAGDRVFILPLGTLLGVWSGPDDDAIRARMAAGGFEPPPDAPLGGGITPMTPGTAIPAGTAHGTSAGLPSPPVPVVLQLAGVLALVLVTSVYFFKGAAWAGSLPAADVQPVSSAELRNRLLAINDLDVPFTVTASPDGDAVEVSWRYADARWLDPGGAHRMRRTHRVVLRLDEEGRTARVTDFAGHFDASAGAGGVNVQWKATTGITFFEVRQGRISGLQVGDDGALLSQGSYAYRFNVQEMKAPLIDAVTRAGWDWRPVLWASAPPWLRWLTE